MTERDFPAYRAMLTSPRSAHMGGPYDLRGAWGMFCHDVACWSLHGHGGLMIDLVATGECVGQVGINAGPLFPEQELGWLLYEGFEGRGYVTEAAAAMRDWAFAQQATGSLVSYIDPTNFRSIAVAERLGAVRDPAAAVQDAGDLVFRHR
jgi:RimJ/RimL family protein N-acetyltransferase